MTSNLYLAYGANINIEGMRYRCPDAVPVKTIMLREWQLEFFNHATIRQTKNAVVPGVIWSLTPRCETSLDIFEGYPYYYNKRTWIQDELQFFFYVMNNEKLGTPSSGYVNNIREGYQQWGLPETYLDQSLKLCLT